MLLKKDINAFLKRYQKAYEDNLMLQYKKNGRYAFKNIYRKMGKTSLDGNFK